MEWDILSVFHCYKTIALYSEGIIFPFMVVYNTNIFENIVQNKEQSGAHSQMFKKVRDPWKVISQ